MKGRWADTGHRPFELFPQPVREVRNLRRYSVGVAFSRRRKARTRVSTVPNPQTDAMRSRVASEDSSSLRAFSTRTDSM